MNETEINHFKMKLETEKALLEGELKTVGYKNDKNPADWDLKVADMNILPADENEVADTMEELESNHAILHDLEGRYADIVVALQKISAHTYGICEVGGEQIETDRLEANPAARTCKAHMNDAV